MTKRMLALAVAAAAAVLVLAAGPASAQYQPTTGQVLGSSVVAPGQSTTVSGFGCPAGSSVTTSFDGTVVGTTTADQAGNFSLQITIPSSATPGAHTITSTCGSLVLSSTVTVSGSGSGATTAGNGSGGVATGGSASTGGSGSATAGTSTGGTLARTGAHTTEILAAGFALLAAGGVLLVLGRTRRRGSAA